MAHGLHVIARQLAPDGSGRDSVFFQDDNWKNGRKGTPAFRTPVARHPLFHSQPELPGLLSSVRQADQRDRPHRQERPVSAVMMPGQKHAERNRPVSAVPSPWHKQSEGLDAPRAEAPPSWQRVSQRDLLQAGVPLSGPREKQRPVSAVPLSLNKSTDQDLFDEAPVRAPKKQTERERPVSAVPSPSKRLTEQDLLEYEVPLHVQKQSERPRPVSAVPGNTQQRNRPVSAFPLPWQRQTAEDIFPEKPETVLDANLESPSATCFRARSNVAILLFAKSPARRSSLSAAELPGTESKNSSPTKSRRPRSAAVLGKADEFAEEEPVWRTRETIIDYNAWATKMPTGMCSAKSVPRRAPLIK